MTDTYLRSLGFTPTRQATRVGRASFAQAWRYQFNHAACDGALLFAEHPLGIDRCRLSAMEAPLTAQDIFAEVGLNDRLGLAAAIKAFYQAHGGMGGLVVPFVPFVYQPYRRPE